MKRRRARALRLVAAFLVSFALTVASFVAGTAVTERRARGIEEAAQSLAENALPSIRYLAQTRTDLRAMDARLDTLLRRVWSGERNVDTRALDDARAELERDWRAYRALPIYPDEPPLVPLVEGAVGALGASIDGVLERLRAGDPRGAAREMDVRTEPAFEAADKRLAQVTEVNRRNAAALSARIADLRRSSHAWALALDTASALFATLAALFVTRIAIGFARIMDWRLSEIHHFAGRIAHDIRSPLTSVGLALERAQQSAELDPKARAVLGRGVRTVQTIGALVDGLLVFALAARTPPDRASAAVREAIDGVVEQLHAVAGEKGIDLSVEEPVPLVEVGCTPGVVISVLANLVGNSIRHMGEAPLRQVVVAARDLGEAVRIEVRDTGPGVPAPLRERIFDPYTGASTVPGLAFGLATARRLAETHGGRLGIEPRAESGSVFFLELPKARTEKRPRRWMRALRSAA